MLRRALLLSAALLALTASPAVAVRYVAGSEGSGDPFFPLAGNGGYDASHYSLAIEYTAETKRFDGRSKMIGVATQNLHRFNLDLRDWMTVESVRVDGHPARFEHEGQELSISPRPKLKEGDRFVVRVVYGGTQQSVIDPDESEEGWIPTDDGAFVVNEPQGSPGWFPVNDSPKDKATYSFTVTVPEGRTVMANGELISQSTEDGKTTWRWRELDPMAPYLTTATNGVFETSFYTLTNGLKMYDAVDPNTRASGRPGPEPAVAWTRLAPQGEIIDFFSNLYGDYPYTSGGGIIDWAPTVGYALESQTRANYHRTPGASTVVHEIAHQWFGNAVTLEVWPDIWLNEGFARWSEWIYTEQHGGATAQSRFDGLYARAPSHSFWSIAPGNVGGPENLFAGQVYDRGAMTLQALRAKIGNDDTFFEILRTWYAENRNGNASTADFVEVSERVSGLELSNFFDVWLYEVGKPTSW
jgi:aminopeptidase N